MKERTISTLLLDGGCLCFDFVNTVHSRTEKSGYEYIRSYDELLQWSRKVNALPGEQVDRLAERALVQPAEAAAVLSYFRETREVTYHFFSALAARRSPPGETNLVFNQVVQEAMRHLFFNAERLPVSLEWQAAGRHLEEPVWAALRSAWEVLYGEDQNRIKECEACGWLFLDHTKNNRKRWCNPANCGSADKARRYYQRKKEKQLPRL